MVNTPNASPEQLSEKFLTKEELKSELVEMKTILLGKYEEEAEKGMIPILPEGTMIGEQDMGGKTLLEVMEYIDTLIETYEPQMPKEEESKAETQTLPEKHIPDWLKGHEALLWHGAHTNPLWELKGKQVNDHIQLSYERRDQKLRPGRDTKEQLITLEPIERTTFSTKEWKIMNEVVAMYLDMEGLLSANIPVAQRRLEEIGMRLNATPEEMEELFKKEDPKEVRTFFQKQILTILREENTYRNKGGDTPALLKKIVAHVVQEQQERSRRKESFSDEAIENMTQDIAEILSQLMVLNKKRGDGKEAIPMKDSTIRIFPSFEQNLSKFASLVEEQVNDNKGLTLVIGEAGVGKNEMVKELAAETKRPYFWFPCGRGMEGLDLVHHYEFDTQEGTKKFFTTLAQGVQTPGSIVLIDEIGALKTEVQAILHGLGDSNRTIAYDGVRIPVAEGVIIVLATNPATYGSSGNLGEALVSRTSGKSMTMDYPALRKGELLKQKEYLTESELQQRETADNSLLDYACDEARILYPAVRELSAFTEEEFVYLWEALINQQPITEGETSVTKKILTVPEEKVKYMTLLEGLRDILIIADEWRKRFEKKERSFALLAPSMRDTIALTKKYNEVRDVKKAYLSIIDVYRKNPIDGMDRLYVSVKQLLDDKLGTL